MKYVEGLYHYRKCNSLSPCTVLTKGHTLFGTSIKVSTMCKLKAYEYSPIYAPGPFLHNWYKVGPRELVTWG